MKTLSKLFTPVPTFSNLFQPIHTCSHLFTLVHTCSHLFTPVHPCSHMFTTVDFSVTICTLPVQFFPCEGDIFRSIFLKLQIFAHLIERFPLYGVCRCKEIKMWIPVGTHTKVTIFALREISIIALSKACSFSVLRPILLKLQVLVRLLESFPSLNGWGSCIERRMSIPLRAHA